MSPHFGSCSARATPFWRSFKFWRKVGRELCVVQVVSVLHYLREISFLSRVIMSTEFDTEAVKDQLDDLHDTLDELEEALVPLKLKDKDSTLDSYGEREGLDSIGKAKILVTIGYAIDSLLFSEPGSDHESSSTDMIRLSENYRGQH